MASSKYSSQAEAGSSHLVYNNQATQWSSTEPDSLDFEECAKDSPRFRQNLKENLAYIESLEGSVSKTLKHMSNYVESGQEHIRAQKEFIASMKSLNISLGSSSLKISKNVNTLLGTLEEISRLHEIVIDQSMRTIGNSLTSFLNSDLVAVKDARKSFDKISHEFDLALVRNSQPIKKQQEDSENLLIATSTAFAHTSLDLSIQITTLQSKKGLDILNSLLSFIKAQRTFFHQGFDLFEDLKPHIKEMDDFRDNVQDEHELMIRSLPSKHLMVPNNKLKPLEFDQKAQQVTLEGYLFKRASNGFKIWNRRWFILRNHQLLYQKRGDTQAIVMEEDLRLLTVRPISANDIDRRHCFEVLSPAKSHVLQADSEAAARTWISAIQAGINAAFHDTDHKSIAESSSSQDTESRGSNFSFKALQQQATNKLNSITSLSDSKESLRLAYRNGFQQHNMTLSGDDIENDRAFKVDEQGRFYEPLKDNDDESSDKQNSNGRAAIFPSKAAGAGGGREPTQGPPEKPQRAYMIILAAPGNDKCADCNAAQPMWASINLGITLCIECAGIHRSLGVHLSKVRSLTLDTEVWSPEIVGLMLSLGNTSVNAAYLSCYSNQMPPLNPDSSREHREAWIKGKYLLKSFMLPPEERSKEESAEQVVEREERAGEESEPPQAADGAKSNQPASDCGTNDKILISDK